MPPASPFSSDPYSGDLMSPEEVRDAVFPSVRLGRRGVDESEVRAFCDRVADELSRSLMQRTALEAEVRRLRERVIGGRGTAASLTTDDAQVHAVNVLTMAQRTADQYVADAQEYSRELAQEAHLRHDEILREAQVRASMILDEAHASAQAAADRAVPSQRDSVNGSGGGRGTPGASDVPGSGGAPGTSGAPGAPGAPGAEAELAYLRTFSHVCRTHLRAYLDSLSASIEEWEKAEEQGLMSARGAGRRHD